MCATIRPPGGQATPPAPPVRACRSGRIAVMSPSSPPAAGNPMRQQLDELDALLQRMLTLPVNQLDDAPADPEPQPHAPANGVGRQPSMALHTDSRPVPPPAPPE